MNPILIFIFFTEMCKGSDETPKSGCRSKGRYNPAESAINNAIIALLVGSIAFAACILYITFK